MSVSHEYSGRADRLTRNRGIVDGGRAGSSNEGVRYRKTRRELADAMGLRTRTVVSNCIFCANEINVGHFGYFVDGRCVLSLFFFCFSHPEPCEFSRIAVLIETRYRAAVAPLQLTNAFDII